MTTANIFGTVNVAVVQRWRCFVTFAVVVLFVSGCEEDFPDFNVIRDFRLLAVRAEPPVLQPDESAMLDALVTEPGATYSWSWCPIPGSSEVGFACAVTEEQAQQAVDAVLGPGTVVVPPFVLGTDPAVSFAYSFPGSLLETLCASLGVVPLPDFADIPKCFGDSFPLHVQLTVEQGGKSITGVRELVLPYVAGGVTNRNPTVEAISVVLDGVRTEIPSDGSLALPREKELQLILTVEDSNAELYVDEEGADGPAEVLEDLTATWFIEGGEVDKKRTSFFDGELSMDNLRTNTWTLPASTVFPDSVMRLFVVLRDNRGGVDWIERSVLVEESP